MDYKEAYEDLFQKVQDSDSPALKLKAMHDKEQREKQQEEQRNEQQQPVAPSQAERLAKQRNERNSNSTLWGK